jgi:peptidoglycan/xylan/chitin deacetylase (PgdA/CDA1 family)
MVFGPLTRRPGVRILTYHSVGSRNHEMNVSPECFRKQMEWLARNAEVIPLSAVLGYLKGGEPLITGTPDPSDPSDKSVRPEIFLPQSPISNFQSPIPNPKSPIPNLQSPIPNPQSPIPNLQSPVVITFDDGYRDNLLNAAPVLSALGLPATVFVVVSRVGGTLDHDEAGPANALMTWQDIEQWLASGLDVGCHSMTHRRLSRLSEAEQRAEIIESSRLLHERIGRPIDAFAYPFGSAYDYDSTSVRLVREGGYACGLSNRYGVNRADSDRWALKRIWIDATDDIKTFQAKVNGRLDILSILDSPAGLASRRSLNRLLRMK